MKRWLLTFALLSLPILIWSQTQEVSWESKNVVVAANINSENLDSSVFYLPVQPNQSEALYYYRLISITNRDTTFAGDTLNIYTSMGVTRNGPWAPYDSTKIAFTTSNNDTTLALAGRIKLDSTALSTNYPWMRLILRHEWDMGATASDTAIVGNVYNFKTVTVFNARY